MSITSQLVPSVKECTIVFVSDLLIVSDTRYQYLCRHEYTLPGYGIIDIRGHKDTLPVPNTGNAYGLLDDWGRYGLHLLILDGYSVGFSLPLAVESVASLLDSLAVAAPDCCFALAAAAFALTRWSFEYDTAHGLHTHFVVKPS